MNKISLAEYKQYLLVILDEIDAYCKKYKITYYLDSGSLLGAVRHKGFIPWDDDIDIIMPRDDYEKFTANFNSNKCTVLTYKSDKKYYYQYAKVSLLNSKVIEPRIPAIQSLGINIDIFPLDGLPDNNLLRRVHQDSLMAWSKVRTLIIMMRNHFPNSMRFLLPYRWSLIILDYLGKKYKYNSSNLVGNIVATTVRHKEIPKDYFVDIIELEFEGKRYPAPKEYDKYLRKLYGDYMKLPPKEKQVSHHRFEAYIGE